MFDEDFEISKSNILVLIITIVITVTLVFTAINTIKSLSEPVKDLPDLEVTQGRTSTLNPKTTTTTTTTTTRVTTTRPLVSPYYEVNMDEYLNEEVLTKQKVLRSEAEEITKILYEFANKFFNLGDNSLLDIDRVVNHAKTGEKDLVVKDGNRYGIIYNDTEIIDKLLYNSNIYTLLNFKHNDVHVFIKENGKYYRLENKMGDAYPVLASLSVKKFDIYKIEAVVSYYMSDYALQGYITPVYKEEAITLGFEDGRWKIRDYKFPSYDK